MLRTLIVSAVMAGLCASAWGQAKTTGNAGHTWQVGAGFSSGPSDYTLPYLKGVTLYASYDLGSRTGVIVEAHLMNLGGSNGVGERSFLFGPRFGFTKAQFHFYIKALIGLGLFQYQKGVYPHTGNDGYEVFAGGGGIEYLAAHHINLRIADFEYQGWPGFPANGLTPWIATTGMALRF